MRIFLLFFGGIVFGKKNILVIDAHHDPKHVSGFGGFKNVDKNSIGQKGQGGSEKNYIELVLRAFVFLFDGRDGFYHEP